MALKFQCENCGKDVAVRFLKVGEAAECKACGAGNPVPESAEEISEEAAEHLIKAPVSESAKRIGNQPTQSLLITKALRIIGTLSIGFGVIAGIAMLSLVSSSPSYGLDAPSGELSLGGVLFALGITLFFGALGTFSLGIAKVLELLNK